MAQEHESRPDLEMRLTRFEEVQAFSERTVEQLNEEIVSVNERLSEAAKRIERLESRLDHLTGMASEVATQDTDEPEAKDHPDVRHEQCE